MIGSIHRQEASEDRIGSLSGGRPVLTAIADELASLERLTVQMQHGLSVECAGPVLSQQLDRITQTLAALAAACGALACQYAASRELDIQAACGGVSLSDLVDRLTGLALPRTEELSEELF